jgi:hypothetical protein
VHLGATLSGGVTCAGLRAAEGPGSLVGFTASHLPLGPEEAPASSQPTVVKVGRPPSPEASETFVNPPLTEVNTMTVASPLHSFIRELFARRRRVTSHREAVPERQLNIPRRIDDPATTAGVANDLLQHRREDVVLAPCLDNRHRLVGPAVLAIGWIGAARLSARPILAAAKASRATGCGLGGYRRHGARGASIPPRRPCWTLESASVRPGLAMVDHLVVVGIREYNSAIRGGRSCRSSWAGEPQLQVDSTRW